MLQIRNTNIEVIKSCMLLISFPFFLNFNVKRTTQDVEIDISMKMTSKLTGQLD